VAAAPARSRPRLTAAVALANHWPEYLMEAFGLGAFMVSACLFTVWLELPGSPFRQLIDSAFVRRALVGLAMGLTAIAIIYSPWGKRSGAHLNPAFTLTFLRLRKIQPWDAFFYAFSQTVGGTLGVLAVAVLMPTAIAHSAINYAVTVPGQAGTAVAFAAEFIMSFLLLATVLTFSLRPQLATRTGLAAGFLIATYITVEAPYSGMSINPARTIASALPSGNWTGFWIYLTAPVLGMLSAAELFLRGGQLRAAFCAKYHHQSLQRCIFCGANGG
jgi:aquaporin Z